MPNHPVPVTASDVVVRARSMVGKGKYKLGKGGRAPSNPTPFVEEQCDCSGFVAWCLGIDRYQPGKVAQGDWIETTAVVKDATHYGGTFSLIPYNHRPGDVIVYGDLFRGKKKVGEGHIAIVETVDENGKALMTIDCASSRGATGAVNRRSAAFFFARNAIVARFKGLKKETT